MCRCWCRLGRIAPIRGAEMKLQAPTSSFQRSIKHILPWPSPVILRFLTSGARTFLSAAAYRRPPASDLVVGLGGGHCCGQECPMPLGFGWLHPAGLDENSPALQRWDRSQTCPSPGGTADATSFQASLRDASATTPTPSVETLGYFRMSLRDRAAGRVSQILVALDINVRAPRPTRMPMGAGTWSYSADWVLVVGG